MTQSGVWMIFSIISVRDFRSKRTPIWRIHYNCASHIIWDDSRASYHEVTTDHGVLPRLCTPEYSQNFRFCLLYQKVTLFGWWTLQRGTENFSLSLSVLNFLLLCLFKNTLPGLNRDLAPTSARFPGGAVTPLKDVACLRKVHRIVHSKKTDPRGVFDFFQMFWKIVQFSLFRLVSYN